MKLAWCDRLALFFWALFLCVIWAGTQFSSTWLVDHANALPALKLLAIIWIPLRVFDFLCGGPYWRSQKAHSGGNT